MAQKTSTQIDALVQRTFAQKMWDNGFHPYKDHTEWLRLVDGNQLVKKVFFDKLRAVFQNLKSSEKPVIANERHP